MNKAIISGRLGKDPEIKEVNGKSLCNITLASSDSYQDREGSWVEKTEWHRVTIWGKRGEAISNRVHKGSKLLIEGQIRTRSWDAEDGTKRYSTEIVATDVEFMDDKKQVQSQSDFVSSSQQQSSPQSSGRDDGMPF